MFTTRPEIAGTFGVVASTHWIASQVGMAVLERGGNAFDAAAATAFTLQVAEPHLNGPGGDAPIILHSARTQTQQVICGQGVAPQAATLEKFRDLDIDLIPATGVLPAVVPGAFDAWCLLLRDWGTWELADVLAFAIGYAKNGIHVVPRISATIEEHAHAVRDGVEDRRPRCSCPAARCPHRKALFARPALAETYERICREAVGDIARGAHRCRARRLVSRLRRRGGGQVLPLHRRAGRDRPPPSRPAGGGRLRALVGDRRGSGRLRLPWPHRAEVRPVEPGAGVPATARPAARLRHRRDGSARHRLRPHRGGMRQARLRRSRGLLRRSQFRQRAARRAAVGRLQRRTPQAGRRTTRRSTCVPARCPATRRWSIATAPAARIC